MKLRFVLLLTALAACGSDTGAVGGDLYVAKDGIVQRMAGEDVYVVPNGDSVALRVARACDNMIQVTKPIEKHKWHLDTVYANRSGIGTSYTFDAPRIVRARPLYDSLTRVGKTIDSLHRILEQGFDSLVLRNATRQSKADINGHFVVDSLVPGTYLLYAFDFAGGGGDTRRWLSRTTVSAGDTARSDLSDVSNGELICYNQTLAPLRKQW